MAEDLGKSTLREEDLRDESKRRLKVLSLTDNAGWLMAVGNDLGYDQIFVQQLMNYGQAGDLLIAISGSGNSPNVLEAVDWANRHDLKTFALTGFDGGKLRSLGQTGPACATGRHGNGRERASLPVPLGLERPVCPHQSSRKVYFELGIQSEKISENLVGHMSESAVFRAAPDRCRNRVSAGFSIQKSTDRVWQVREQR